MKIKEVNVSAYEKVRAFIENDMRMSQVYQPVMLLKLLKSNGQASVAQVAQAILDKDPTQIEYYSSVVKNMVGRVCSGQVISDSTIDFSDVDSRSKALGDMLPSFECSLNAL